MQQNSIHDDTGPATGFGGGRGKARAEPVPHQKTSARVPTAGSRMLQGWAKRMLAPSGIKLDGPEPWDIRVHDSRLYARVFLNGTLGFGEAYIDGWWDAEDLAGCIARLLVRRTNGRLADPLGLSLRLRRELLNLQQGRGAWAVGRRHYDLEHDLFEAMLGKSLVYSCGYWKTARDLDSAQRAKLDLCCRKLDLEPGMRVLDIGCGWGEALRHAAQHYGVSGVGLTVSGEQAERARNRCRDLPIDIRLMDYRDLDERFDRIFSIGMFEHVGAKNFGRYFDTVERSLDPQGLFLLHTIGHQGPHTTADPWIERYIFPNSAIPALGEVLEAFRGRFILEDWQNLGLDYERTLLAWHGNFEQAWPRLRTRYDEPFRRLWRYYLLASAASFRVRRNQLWQVVLTPPTRAAVYRGYR